MRKSRIKAQTSLKVIGMMSGTSLDGVDFAFCQFTRGIITEPNASPWRYHLIACRTFQYPKYIIDLIGKMQSPLTSFLQFKKLEILYTKFIIETLNLFTSHFSINQYDLLSVHGHTMFHQPQEHITVQAINLNFLAGQLKVDVCGNFRELDVFRGGQGAPLAPYGQQIFAGQAFINLGGIANISYRKNGYDINFCNLFFNYITEKHYHCAFDKDGSFGRQGTPNDQIINYFVNNSVFQLGHSLAREQFEIFIRNMQKSFAQYEISDILASYYHFLSLQIIKMTQGLIKDEKTAIMCTGGGAKNNFLLELINAKSKFEFIVPNQELIDFKQAIVFAFLGVKMLFGQINCSSGVGGNLVKGSICGQKRESKMIVKNS